MFSSSDTSLKRLFAVVWVLMFLLISGAFAFGVIRPKPHSDVKCISYSYKLSFNPVYDLFGLELKQPVWTRSCTMSVPLH